MKIYDLPTFSSTLEFLTMLALSTGCLDNPGSGGQVETTGRAQIVNALGMPFVLEGLFVEAEAIDAEPDSELAADAMGVDVEDDAEGAAATADGRNDG
jgi:hypothetical protein